MDSMASVNRWMTKLAAVMHLDGRRDLRVPTNLTAPLSGRRLDLVVPDTRRAIAIGARTLISFPLNNAGDCAIRRR